MNKPSFCLGKGKGKGISLGQTSDHRPSMWLSTTVNVEKNKFKRVKYKNNQ